VQQRTDLLGKLMQAGLQGGAALTVLKVSARPPPPTPVA
jgi:hypothetical protein